MIVWSKGKRKLYCRERGLIMAQIRSIDAIAKKFATVTPGRSEDYRYGVENPKKDWQRSTAAAESAYEAGVQSAIGKKRFGRGVSKAGNQAWQDGAKVKGVARWGPGIAIAEPKYREGFAPFRDAIERATLPPRYAKRDPRNLARVKSVVDALVVAKESALGRS